jgi:hypothetical protein
METIAAVKYGAKDFDGKWIQFGSDVYPNWQTVLQYLNRNNDFLS